MEKPLGREIPTDFVHIEKYPLRAIWTVPVARVEKIMTLPPWHRSWDQGSEGACVGFGVSMVKSIIDTRQARDMRVKPYDHRYDPWYLWNRSKMIDEFPGTNPGDSNGTTVRAAMDVLRLEGHVRILRNKAQPLDLKYGIATNRWATTVDEIRTSIASNVPVAIGVNWYTNFDHPVKKNGEWWIGEGNLGTIRGGHCVAEYGASDRRQAFKLKNNWGKDYPEVWIPYSTMQRLLNEDGEATLITDR